RTSWPSTARVRATRDAASRIDSISSLPLRNTVRDTTTVLEAEGPDHGPVNHVHRAQPFHFPQPRAGAVVLHQRRGLPRVHLEPANHRLRRVVRALAQLDRRMIIAVHAIPRRP